MNFNFGAAVCCRVLKNDGGIVMTSRAQQEEYLATVAQSFDAGDYDFLSPEKMRELNSLIAAAWKTLRAGGEIEVQLNEIQQLTQSL